MKQLRVTNIQRGCVYDGPGVRTTVFLKGCSLHCPWCCNPETIKYDEEWFVDDSKCFFLEGIHSNFCHLCERSGGQRSIRDCPFGVCEKVSDDYEIKNLYEILIKDKSLYNISGGGITFSGGEPLLQAKSLTPLLIELKKADVNIALESTLMAPLMNLKMVLDYVDIWVVDLKLQPEMFLLEKGYLDNFQHAVGYLPLNSIIYRIVFTDSMISYKDEILVLLNRIAVKRIELLPCHNLGEKKYKKLSLVNKDYSSNYVKACNFADYLVRNNIQVSVLSI